LEFIHVTEEFITVSFTPLYVDPVSGLYLLLTWCCLHPQAMTHLKDAFFLTLDDVQVWVVDGLEGALNQMERVSDTVRMAVQQLQETQVGQAATAGLDNVLSLLEDTTAYYLPLPPTLRECSRCSPGREWEMRVQEYEDEDDGDEPSLWTRVRSLLLTLSLQLYHRTMKVREQLQSAVRTLGGTADQVRPNTSRPAATDSDPQITGQENVSSAGGENLTRNFLFRVSVTTESNK
ncbi:hypothetical protein XENOCAPTIV_018505, partial [Xenoophorus captivus]